MFRKTITIKNFEDLFANLTGPSSEDCYQCGFSVFRGVSDTTHKLVPSIGRSCDIACREVEVFEEYIKFAQAYGEDIGGLSRINQLASAQHAGVPTRLLDWSLSPLTAIFFATEPKLDGANKLCEPTSDAALYIMHCCDRLDITTDPDPFEIEKIQLFHPSEIRSKRLIAQQGVFSLHPNPGCDLAKLLTSKDKEEGLWVDMLVIPKSEVLEIHDKISFLGINHRAIFPDQFGLAQSLRHGPRNGHQFPC